MKNNINYKVIVCILLIFLAINFFRYPIFYTWDSSQYVGMASSIGTSLFSALWNPIRRFLFPFILKIFQILPIDKVISFKIMLFIAYIIVLFIIYRIAREFSIFKDKKYKMFYTIAMIILVILNPLIFLYFHTMLTEFIGITISITMVYLNYKWAITSPDTPKKFRVVSILIIAITTASFHVKPSLCVMILFNIIIACLLSIRKKETKNLIKRVSVIVLSLISILLTNKIWNYSVSKLDIEEDPEQALESFMINSQLMVGLSELDKNYNSKNITLNGDTYFYESSGNIESIDLDFTDEEIEKMNDVLKESSEYSGFTIYTSSKNQSIKYIFFTRDDYSLKEQIVMWFKVFNTHPSIVFKSYLDGYLSATWKPKFDNSENEEYLDYYYKRDGVKNVSYHIDPKYEEYLNGYYEPVTRDFTSDINFHLSEIYGLFTKTNFILLPLLLLESIVFYILDLKRHSNNTEQSNLIKIVVLLYSMAFFCVFSYIIFGARLDRYTMPAHIPMFIGDVILITYIFQNKCKRKN